MKQSQFYHQLSVYLLSENRNVHHGALVSASAFIYDMPETTEETRFEIRKRMEKWFGEYHTDCVNGAFTSVRECDITPILSALDEVIGNLHFIGHDVIQASAALKGLDQLGDAPQGMVEKISSHIRATKDAQPGLFYGYSADEIREREASFCDYEINSSPRDVANSLVRALRQIKRSYFGFHFLSQETHLITHAEAIITLNKLGHHELFKKSLKGWYLRLHLLERIQDLNLDETHESPEACNWDPRSPSFWSAYEPYALNIHPIKTMFSYLKLKQQELFSEEDILFLERNKLLYLADAREIKISK